MEIEMITIGSSNWITFGGSFVASLVWAQLLVFMDASGTSRPSSAFSALAFAVVVAGVFLIADILVSKRVPANTLWWSISRIALVSLIGTVVIVGGLFLVLLSSGYVQMRYISVEIVGIFFLGSLLFLSTFLSVLGLLGTATLLGLGRDK